MIKQIRSCALVHLELIITSLSARRCAIQVSDRTFFISQNFIVKSLRATLSFDTRQGETLIKRTEKEDKSGGKARENENDKGTNGEKKNER